MARTFVVILMLAVVAGVVMTSTSRRADVDFRFDNRASINTLDPAQMSYAQDIRLARSLGEGVTTLTPQTLAPAEGAAYFPPQLSDDRRTYTFPLRPDAKWCNGDAVTAHDFERAWRRAIEPGSSDVYAEMITAYVDGAGAYADWRLEHSALLGLVRQLQKDSPIAASSAHAALASSAGSAFAQRFGCALPEPSPPAADPLWDRLIAQLRSQTVEWKRVGDALLDAHLAEMPARWGRVGIRAIDDGRLEVRLARPTTFYLDITSFATYLPIHKSIELLCETYEGRPVTDAALWAYDEQWTKPDYHRNGYPGLMTNGPYRLAAWDFKQRVLFEANPFYWRADQVQLKRIEVVDVDYQNTGWMLYDQGRFDLICELSMDYLPSLVRQMREGQRKDIHTIPSFATYYYTLNCRPTLWDGRPNPLSDARVRRALDMAVNKQELVDFVERLNNPPSTTLVPPGQLPGYHSPAGLPYDVERARRELAAAGYPGGRGLLPIEILYNTGADHEVKAQAIKRMWETELGISCVLVGKELKTFADDKANARFMVGRAGWFGDYNDPTTFLNLARSTESHNFSGFKDAHYDGLLEAAANEPDAARRLATLSEAEKYLVEDQVPLLPLFTYVTVWAWRPEVIGIYPNPRLFLPLQALRMERGPKHGS